MTRKLWTEEEDKYIKENWSRQSTEIAAELKRTKNAIENRRKLFREKGFKVIQICPNCGSRHNNEVHTATIGDGGKGFSVIQAYYCLDCLHEFKDDYTLRPLI